MFLAKLREEERAKVEDELSDGGLDPDRRTQLEATKAALSLTEVTDKAVLDRWWQIKHYGGRQQTFYHKVMMEPAATTEQKGYAQKMIDEKELEWHLGGKKQVAAVKTLMDP